MTKSKRPMAGINIHKMGEEQLQAHINRTGAGKHGDRRTKRLRDRGAKKRNAIRESYDS